jgi:hypothetical protein
MSQVKVEKIIQVAQLGRNYPCESDLYVTISVIVNALDAETCYSINTAPLDRQIGPSKTEYFLLGFKFFRITDIKFKIQNSTYEFW